MAFTAIINRFIRLANYKINFSYSSILPASSTNSYMVAPVTGDLAHFSGGVAHDSPE